MQKPEIDVQCIKSIKKTVMRFCIRGHKKKTNKWSKNFDEMPHRCLVTPRGGTWIRPTLSPSSK